MQKQEKRGSGALWILLLAFALVFRVQIIRLIKLLFIDPDATLREEQNQLRVGVTFEQSSEHEHYIKRRVIEDGIERISYLPKNQRFDTPILFQHGMWHGAWCWAWWQALFAEWGWESHAISWPGHAGSPVQRPIPECTLDYYLSFLKAEMARYDTPPILIGHSMGGALAQWYLKYVTDDLPAVVLLATAPADSTLAHGFIDWLVHDPVGMALSWLKGDADPLVRSPEAAAQKLITSGAMLSPEDLHSKLGSESALILFQHNPPLWTPRENIAAPLLIVAGERDAIIKLDSLRESAAFYRADFKLVNNAAHNLMMEHNQAQTAKLIHDWLVAAMDR